MLKLMKSGLGLSLIAGTAALLSGCVVPEKFDANISMAGYRYSVSVGGIIAEPQAVAVLAKGGQLTEVQEQQLKAQEAGGLKTPGMTAFSYAGKGRYDFAMKFDGELTDTNPAIGVPATGAGGFLTIKREADGTVVIATAEVPAQALADLKSINLGASGTVKIEIQGKVLESNADTQPSGGDPAYVWNRTSWEDRVYLKFDPTQP